MTPEQIQLLYNASLSPELNGEQRNRLTLVNPWTQNGPVAQVMQREVARLDPQQAKAWIADSGSTLSLQAAAAQQGLAEMTPAIEMELRRLCPMTQEEQVQQQVDQILSKGNPYGSPARYVDGPDGQPQLVEATAGNLTDQLVLQGLNPGIAAQCKAEAMPAAPTHSFTPSEIAGMARLGYHPAS